MVLVHELVHPRGLSFAQQKKVVCLRGEWLSWEKIAQKVKNFKGGTPRGGKRSGDQGPMWGAESLNGAGPFDVLPDRRIRTPAQMAHHLVNRKRFAGYGFGSFPRPLPFSKKMFF